MTYIRYHLYFNLPMLALLLVWPAGKTWGGSEWSAAAIVIAAGYAFTIPWDSTAVAQGLWDFAEGKHWKRAWRMPVEEYLFFGLQAVEVLLFVNGLIGLRLGGTSWTQPASGNLPVVAAFGVLAVVWIFLRFAGVRRAEKYNYAWHVFYWFLPVIGAEWIAGWGILAPRWPLLVLPAVVIGGWLTLADLVAVRTGLWRFDPKQVTGTKLFGISPWEESAFLCLTSLLVAQSYLLLLPESSR